MSLRLLAILSAAALLRAQQPGDPGAKSALKVRAPDDPAQFVKQAKVAVVVGESDYDIALNFHPLKFAGEDAEELAEVLRGDDYTIVGDCPPDKPQPVKGGGCALTGPLANYSKLKLALTQAVRMVSDGQGTLLFYFSGHGVQKDETSPQYMVLYGGDYSDLDRAAFKVDELNKILKGTTARKILLIDACRSGEEDITADKKSAAGPSDVFREMAAATGTRIMNSTRHPFSSWEDNELGHGRFSYYLLKGLLGEAAETNGLITFDSLFRYVKRGVDQQSAKHIGQTQEVHQGGDFNNDFYVAGNWKPESMSAVAVTQNQPRPRRALLIGNDAYIYPLEGAVNDATAIHAALTGMSFQCVLLKNLPGTAMEAAIDRFSQSVQSGDDVLFYFAGKSALFGGQPFLAPVDYQEAIAAPSPAHRGITVKWSVSDADAERLYGFPLRKLVGLLSLKADVRKMLILDICMTPPDPSMSPIFAMPPVSDGLTAMLFAASPGQQATEVMADDGWHGVFTRALLTALKSKPGLTWPELSAQAWDLTRNAGIGNQTPFPFGFLASQFRFAPQ